MNETYSQEAYELSVNDFKNVHAHAHYTVCGIYNILAASEYSRFLLPWFEYDVKYIFSC